MFSPGICCGGSRVTCTLQMGSGAQGRAIAGGSKARAGYLALSPKPSELVRVPSGVRWRLVRYVLGVNLQTSCRMAPKIECPSLSNISISTVSPKRRNEVRGSPNSMCSSPRSIFPRWKRRCGASRRPVAGGFFSTAAVTTHWRAFSLRYAESTRTSITICPMRFSPLATSRAQLRITAARIMTTIRP